MSLKFLLDFSLIKKTIWNSVYSVYSGAKLNYWNFFLLAALCVRFAFQLNGKWELKKLHHGLIYWGNFGFSLDVQLACSTK